MRAINKTKVLSSVYYQWQAENPKAVYDSSSNYKKYYKDVVMNLLSCQSGLCAYTEMQLRSPKKFSEHDWENGKYALVIDEIELKPQCFGVLDHFNPDLKTEQGWLWDNFFLVHSHINNYVKGKKKVDNILKPDLENFEPFRIFDYDIEKHIFIPNSENLNEAEQERVFIMIQTLGLNYGAVVDAREDTLNPIFARIQKKKDTWEEVETEIYQFFTAFEFCKRSANN
jgi:hypothetical protein